MNKKKIYLGILTITNVLWIFALLRAELSLIKLSSSLSEYSFFGNIKVPFLLHLVILMTIVSLIAWLWYNFKEIIGLYSSDLAKTKEKIHQITAEKPKADNAESRGKDDK